MSGLFSTTAPAAAAPVVTPPAPMPDSNSPAVLEAQRKAQSDILARAGRQSTILTAPQNRGNSGPYTSTALGAGT